MAQITVHRPARRGYQQRPARTGFSGGWSGFSDLFDDFLSDYSRGFPGFSAGPRSYGVPGVRSRGIYPPINLHETADVFVLTAELPGVAPEDIDISLEGKTVTLSGQRKVDTEAGDGKAVHRRERQSGHFKRALELPTDFDVESAEASHRAGVLELRLPKKPEAKARQIEVQTSS